MKPTVERDYINVARYEFKLNYLQQVKEIYIFFYFNQKSFLAKYISKDLKDVIAL